MMGWLAETVDMEWPSGNFGTQVTLALGSYYEGVEYSFDFSKLCFISLSLINEKNNS